MTAQARVEEIPLEDGLEGVPVRAAEDAVGADYHMDVEGVHVVTEETGGAAAFHDSGENVERGCGKRLACGGAQQMLGVVNVFDGDQPHEVLVRLVVVEGQLGELAHSVDRIEVIDIELLLE